MEKLVEAMDELLKTVDGLIKTYGEKKKSGKSEGVDMKCEKSILNEVVRPDAVFGDGNSAVLPLESCGKKVNEIKSKGKVPSPSRPMLIAGIKKCQEAQPAFYAEILPDVLKEYDNAHKSKNSNLSAEFESWVKKCADGDHLKAWNLGGKPRPEDTGTLEKYLIFELEAAFGSDAKVISDDAKKLIVIVLKKRSASFPIELKKVYQQWKTLAVKMKKTKGSFSLKNWFYNSWLGKKLGLSKKATVVAKKILGLDEGKKNKAIETLNEKYFVVSKTTKLLRLHVSFDEVAELSKPCVPVGKNTDEQFILEPLLSQNIFCYTKEKQDKEKMYFFDFELQKNGSNWELKKKTEDPKKLRVSAVYPTKLEDVTKVLKELKLKEMASASLIMKYMRGLSLDDVKKVSKLRDAEDVISRKAKLEKVDAKLKFKEI